VKSAYKLAISRREQEKARDGSGSNDTDLCEESFDWKKIWNLRLPNTRRGVKCETICTMRCRLDGDCGHLFFKCQGVKEVWHMLLEICPRDNRISLYS